MVWLVSCETFGFNLGMVVEMVGFEWVRGLWNQGFIKVMIGSWFERMISYIGIEIWFRFLWEVVVEKFW